MKRSPSKADVRDRLQQDIEAFLRHGGEVEQMHMGASALNDGEAITEPFQRPRQERTPLPQVVAAIEARRQSKLAKNQPKAKRRKSPRKKVIYDDFGEPIREVWIED